MVSSNRRVFASILLVLALASLTHAQKDQTASISGKVTLKDKGLAGIVVVATEVDYSGGGWQQARNRGTTDDEGNYRINNVPPGTYQVYPVALALVTESGESNQRLAVTAGETIRNVDFAMVHGGVITGRVTDADGQPLIEEHVNVAPVEPGGYYERPNNFTGLQTDDRGIYRAFGLRRGKYKVSVGQSSAILLGYVRRVFRETYYPSVTDPEKATILEVTESSEIKDINIVTTAATSTFKVTGRVIDGETGKPLPNVIIGVSQSDGNSSSSSSGGISSNMDGEFKIENAAPGRYTLFAVPRESGDWRSDPLTIDVVDKDLTGLEIKTKHGASLQGVVVLESTDNKTVVANRSDLYIFASIMNPSAEYFPTNPVKITADGSFKIGGLAAGNVRLSVRERKNFRLLEIASIEQNGAPLPDGINVKDGEQVTGLQIVVRPSELTGTIRGQIKFENGEPPAGARILVTVNRLGESPSKPRMEEMSPPEVDSRGRFLIERLGAGTYELRVMIYQPGGPLLDDGPRQQVTVTENAVSDVTVTVKLKP